MSKYFYIFSLFLLSIPPIVFGNSSAYSQNNIDSLTISMQNATGYAKIDLLNLMCDYYNDNEARKSIQYADQAVALSKDLNYNIGIQKGLHNLAVAQYQLHKYEKALKNFREEIHYIDTSQNAEPLVDVYNIIGVIYEILGNQEESVNYHKKCLELLAIYPDIETLAKVNINLALDFYSLELFDSTLKYVERTKQIISDHTFVMSNVKTHIQVYIAELYYLIGNPDKAYDEINIALGNQEDLQSKYEKSSLFLVLGKIYFVKEQYTKATSSFEKAILLAQEVGQPRREMEARINLSDLYKKTRQFDSAYNQLQLHNQVKDSTTTAEKNRLILETEAIFEEDRIQREIELLKNENAIKESELLSSKFITFIYIIISLIIVISIFYLVKAYRIKKASHNKLKGINKTMQESEIQLHELNNMKDSLINVVANDLQEPLSQILSHATELKSMVKTEPVIITNTSTEIFVLSQSINNLLDNILCWAKLQNGDYEIIPVLFNIKNSIEVSLSSHLGLARNKSIKIDVNCSEHLLAYGDTYAYEITIGNLIDNAIRYSKKGDRILVKIEEKNGEVISSVIDSGIGMSKSKLQNLFDKSGYQTAHKNGVGIGLKVCKQFTYLNKGKIWLESTPDKGTKAFFTYKAKE